LSLLDPKSKSREEDKNETKKVKHEAEDYLQFIGFLTSINLSYAQIEKIGKFLQKAAKDKRLGFLKTTSFFQKFHKIVLIKLFKMISIKNLAKHHIL